MISSRFVRQSMLLLCLSVIVTGVFAQSVASGEYKPKVGQQGKDVVWVPTCQVLVDKMLDMAKVTPQDYVIDLGSGDGRLVIAAAKHGAHALGIEYNPDMVALSKRNAAKEGVVDKAQFIKADIFESDFSQATIITLFLMPELNLKLRPQILNLKPGRELAPALTVRYAHEERLVRARFRHSARGEIDDDAAQRAQAPSGREVGVV